jgi:phytanoyl-CoA hydroxylase
LASKLLGEDASPKEISGEYFNKAPVYSKPTPPHQDNFYFAFEPCSVVTIWMALDDVDKENGALSYIPGSHNEELRRHQASGVLGFSQSVTGYTEADVAREVLVEGLRPGDCICHHGQTIHRAGANTTMARQRRAFAVVYKGASCHVNKGLLDAYMTSLKQQQKAHRKDVQT